MKLQVLGLVVCLSCSAFPANAQASDALNHFSSGRISAPPPRSITEEQSSKSSDNAAALADGFHSKLQAASVSVAKEFEYVPFERKKEFAALKGKYEMSSQQLNPQRSRVKATEAVSVKAGWYVSKDQSLYNDEVNSVMELIKEDDGSWGLQGIYGAADTISIDIDAATGIVSIPPQKIGYSETYSSDVFIYAVDFASGKYSKENPITGTIDSNGVITLGSWAVMIASGEHEGGIFDAYESSRWMPSNATITLTDDAGATQSVASLIEQNYDNEIIIHNFCGNAIPVSATLTSSQQVKIAPQYIFTNIFYGDFYCYSVDLDSKKIDTKSPILGTGTSSSLSIGSYVVSARQLPTTVAQIVSSAEITTTATIRYPQKVDVAFEGTGSQSNPYQITSVKDLEMLSQSVADGESYQGIYFKQTADVDLSGASLRYVPIGDTSTPFQGDYDGNGMKIKNLNVDFNGFNYGGVFGYIGKQGAVSHLSIENAQLSGQGSYYGLLAGYSQGVIDDCHAVGKLTIKGVLAGGLVGASEGAMRNSSFEGQIAGYGSIGGIAGNSHGEISKCHAIGAVTVNGYVSALDTDAGGLVGEAYKLADTQSSISDSYFQGIVNETTGNSYIGGLVGLCVSTSIDRSFNVGTITGIGSTDSDTASGGLIGFANDSKITDSYNAGTIIRQGTSEGAGGLVGYLSVVYSTTGSVMTIEDMSLFTNCYNSAMVQSSSVSKNKGLYGRTFKAYGLDPTEQMFVNCYFDRQSVGLKNEKYGKPTEFFIGGQLQEGFKSDVWSAKQGFYPTLTGIGDNSAASLSESSLQFSNGETVNKVKNSITLNSASGITWQLYDSANQQYVTETASLKISGNQVTVKDIYADDLLVARTSDGSSMKAYYLAVVPKVFDGEGTEESPYLIKSKADFIKLNDAVQTHGQPHEDDFFKMTADIDFEKADDFQGIGGKGGKNPFAGTFDGAGHYIHNLKIHAATYDSNGKADFSLGSYYFAGLFNVCGPASTIKNINIADDCDFDFWAESAPVVGYTDGRVENCRNYAPVKGVYLSFGGIVGVADSTAVVSRCYNAGEIQTGTNMVGGIVGYNMGLVELSQNDGKIVADYYNAYTKKGTQNIAGGIVGQCSGQVDRSLNNGDVVGYSNVGGIAGVLTAFDGTIGKVTNCLNTGLVSTFEAISTRGAIAGAIQSGGSIEKSYYDASININGAADNSTNVGATGLSTSKLIEGEALDGLSKDDWLFVKGTYPGITDFAYEDASIALRNTYMKFADGEIRTNMTGTVDLANRSALKWTLSESENFVLDGSRLSVTNPTDMSVATATLTAAYGEKYTKVYELTAIPQNIFDGDGTESNPYQIKTIDDMTKLADFISASSMEYEGYFFKLINDLDYTDAEYKPVATGSVNFQADFDGNGKTISNFAISNLDSRTGTYVGFFGNLGGSGSIHDLTLQGSVEGYRYVGGVVGKLYGSIDNVVNKSSVSVPNSTYAGGIAAYAYEGAAITNSRNEGTVSTKGGYNAGIVAKMDAGTVVDNCVNTGSLTTLDNKSGNIGGITATSSGTVKNSSNTAAITGTSALSGVVANASKGYLIENCFNTANITGTSSGIGGVLGKGGSSSTGVIKDCYNEGNIQGSGDTGGLVGSLDSGATVENCYNKGDVTTTKSSNTGGVFGIVEGDDDYPTVIRNVHNSGLVSGVNNCVGGIAGVLYDEYVTIEDSYNLGDISAFKEEGLGVGGISGDLSGTAVRCWNAGNIKTSFHGAGGIGGYAAGTAESCFNLGNITSTNNTSEYGVAGGVWGYGRSKMRNCYNMGTITAPIRIGGIIGGVFTEAVIANCYNAGKLVVDDKSKSGSIAYGSPGNLAECEISNNYFDTTVNPEAFDVDATIAATGLPSQQLFNAELGEAFVITRAAYPTLDGIAEPTMGDFHAASIAFKNEADNEQNVTDQFYVGTFDNIAWTSSDNVVIDNEGVADTKAVGEAWVKATAEFAGETLEKTIVLTIAKETLGGVGEIAAGKVVVAQVFYGVNGVEVAEPQEGALYVVKTIYDDGSSSVSKSYYEKR